jgi:hypothetical protein
MNAAERIRMRCVECGDCLIWPGACAGGTAPTIRHKGKNFNARRVLWEAENGPQPAGTVMGVLCESRHCMRHIAPVAPAIVARRRVALGLAVGIPHARAVAEGKRKKSRWSDGDLAGLRSGAEPVQEAIKRLGMNESYAYAIARGEQRRNFRTPFVGLGA